MTLLHNHLLLCQRGRQRERLTHNCFTQSSLTMFDSLETIKSNLKHYLTYFTIHSMYVLYYIYKHVVYIYDISHAHTFKNYIYIFNTLLNFIILNIF